MILKALYDLARQERLMEDPNLEWKLIAWLIRLDAEGRLLNIESTHYIPDDRKTKRPKKPIPKPFLVPRAPVRTIKDTAFFLYDKAEYVFGVDPAGTRSSEKLSSRFQLFRDHVRK